MQIGIVVILIAFGMLMLGCIPASEAYIIEQTSEQKRSTVLGIYSSGTENGGLLVGAITPAMSHLIDEFGFYTSFSCVSASMTVVATIYSIYLWINRK